MSRTIYSPYTEFPIVDSTNKIIGSIFKPMVDIMFTYKHSLPTTAVAAVVDSGADYNLFPVAVATALKIDLKKAPKKSIIGIGGKVIEAHTSPITIIFESELIHTEADFTDEGNYVLLGRNGFFDYFEYVKFSEESRSIEFCCK